MYGNSFQSFLVAVCNPSKAALERWAQEKGIDEDFDALCKNPNAKEYILGELAKIGKEKKVISQENLLIFLSFVLFFRIAV